MTAINETTTELAAVRGRRKFTWGKVVAVHDIGRYTFVEYKSHAYENGDPTGDLESVSSFHIYLDGQSTSNSAKSLESAMLHAVALGKLEVNEARWMAIGAMKLMGIES